MEINLIEKQKEVNEKCGFQADNLDGLILGLISEIGELASVVALKEGLKKPKPKDLEKFGDWKEPYKNSLYENWLIHPSATGDPVPAFTFDMAFNHEITQKALIKEIADELADVLVYFLQISIHADFPFTSLDKFRDETYPAESPSNEVISLLPILLGLSVQAMKKEENTPAVETNLCFIANILLSIAKHYEIDLQEAYLNKCEKM